MKSNPRNLIKQARTTGTYCVPGPVAFHGYCRAHWANHGKDTAFKLPIVQLEASLVIQAEVQQLRREWQERPQDGSREEPGGGAGAKFKIAQAYESLERKNYIHHQHYF